MPIIFVEQWQRWTTLVSRQHVLN
uniref:Uncharacterized protein n=1 Tax=Rhizophora mucronata TaxID=61149 RepID=A0A2P2PS10_RHIMU